MEIGLRAACHSGCHCTHSVNPGAFSTENALVKYVVMYLLDELGPYETVVSMYECPYPRTPAPESHPLPPVCVRHDVPRSPPLSQ